MITNIMDSQLGSRSKKRWLILIGLFAVGFLDVGTMKSFGVFIEKMTQDLHTSLAVVGLAIGLSHGAAQSFAVVNVPLLKRFSAGKLVLAGSTIAATGFCLITFATSGVHFLLLMLLTGFGFSVVILPSQVSVIDYFPDHFEIATTVVILGSGVGMMTLPLLTEELVMAYSWRGAILILGALNFHSCVTGFLMASGNRQVQESRDSSTMAIGSQVVEEHEETVSLIDGPESIEPHDMDEYVDDNNNDGHFRSFFCAAKRLFLDTFDMKLFCDYPRFITVYLTYFTFAVTYCGWIVFLIPNAEAKGIRSDRAVLLATVGGAANILGRLTIGLHAARFKMKPQYTYCFISILSAGAFFGNFFTKSFSILCCFAAMNGFTLGGKAMSSNFLCKDCVPDERFPAALSFLSLLFGIGEVLGALFIGLLYDATKSFAIMFCVLGVANVLEACFIISPVILDRIVTIVTNR